MILPVLSSAVSLQMPLMQALLCDSHIALLKAEGKVFMKQLQQRAALADLLTAVMPQPSQDCLHLPRYISCHHAQVTCWHAPVYLLFSSVLPTEQDVIALGMSNGPMARASVLHSWCNVRCKCIAIEPCPKLTQAHARPAICYHILQTSDSQTDQSLKRIEGFQLPLLQCVAE